MNAHEGQLHMLTEGQAQELMDAFERMVQSFEPRIIDSEAVTVVDVDGHSSEQLQFTLDTSALAERVALVEEAVKMGDVEEALRLCTATWEVWG